MNQENKPKTTSGLEPNIAGLLCYVLGWITGIIFLVIEKENTTVRFHAVQSIVVFGVFTILEVAIGWIPVIGWIVGAAAFILWVLLMYRAYRGEKWSLPVAGPIAEKNSKAIK
jgi:uncharacterized membrane protein